MKKFLISLVLSLATLVPLGAVASASCDYQCQYNAVYCYPTGSYWAAQRAAYPQYYAANNAYYTAAYGC